MENRNDIYQIITDRILAQLENGIIPWKKPWTALEIKYEGRKTHTETRIVDVAYSRSTGKPYSLLNQMLLWLPGEWASFKQISEAGGKVKKSEKSSLCVFWKFIDKPIVKADGTPVLDPTGKPMIERIPYLRYYNVFHVATQCEGIEPKKRKHNPGEETVIVVDDPGTRITPTDAEWEAVEEADAVVRAYLDRTGCKLTEEPGSERAYYAPYSDSITIPCRAQFKLRSEFYSTMFHEVVHSTGHSSRLNRLDTGKNAAFGSEEYSKEELVAEIGSACLNATFGIEDNSSFRNSAAYIQNWSMKLREDKRMIVSASSRAEKAVRYILDDQHTTSDDGE